MSSFKIHETTYKAVLAALEAIDAEYGEVTMKSAGPCGDKLATELHKVIHKALTEVEEGSK